MKTFFCTIPMNDPQRIKSVDYSFSGDERRKDIIVRTKFPAIAMLKTNLKPGDDFEIVVMWTDKPFRTEENAQFTDSVTNLNSFYEELDQLSDEMGMNLKEKAKEIVIPFDESKEKQMFLFRRICNSFIKDSEVYMDLTYGTKMSIITGFASVTYAEKACNCYIKEMLYGSFDFGKSAKATIYDIRTLYEMSALIQSASIIPGIDISGILDMYEEE